MAWLDSIIMATCVGLPPGPQNDACQKALQAGAKQSGVEQNMSTRETEITKEAEVKTKNFLGTKNFDVVGGTLFLATSVANKSVMIPIPATPICKSVKVNVSQDKSMLNLEWKF